MQFDLEGKTVLVTGASRGIGRAISVAVAEAGADVAGLARTRESLLQLGDEIEAGGRRFLPLVTDLTDADAIAIKVEQPKRQILKFEGDVLLMTRTAITVRSRKNYNLVRTFT